jgi:DNA-binding winged helix-turn-helix (wHTH) protein/tetratricopeptide (TPR) repeat protein
MFYRFGDYQLDFETSKLWRNEELVSDDDKIVQLLYLLCKGYPEVIDKQFLIDSLWPDQVVTDWSLSRLVSDTRQLLGDSGKDQGYIKTVRGRGFRLNLEFEQVSEKYSPPSIKPHQNSNKTNKVNKTKIAGIAASIVFLGFVLISLLAPSRLEAIPGLPLRVAVLPISGANDEPIDEWLKYGIMSMISEQLDQYEAINTLPVASVITAIAGLGDELSSEVIGAKQFEAICGTIGCSHLVVIKYNLTEQKKQNLSYQIIRKNSRSAINEFTEQDVIESADMLLDHLSTDLLPSETYRRQLKQTYSQDNKANRDYAIGVHELHSGDVSSAKIYLELALKRQPDFFWAKAYLAEVTYREGKIQQAQDEIKSLKLISKDDDKLYFLKHLNSNVLYSLDKLDESLVESKTLLNNAFVSGNKVLQGTELLNIGSTLQALNKPDEAMIYLNRAMEAYLQADFSPGVAKAHYNIANVYLTTNRFEEALVQYQKAKEGFKRCSMTGYALMAKHRVATTSSLTGKYQNAKSELVNLIDEYQAHGDEEGVILATLDLAIINFETEEFDLALTVITKLITKLESAEFPYYKNQALGIAVRTSLMLDNVEDAESYFSQIKESQRKDYRAGYILMPAFILHAQGKLQAAVDKAKQIKQEIGDLWLDNHQAKLGSLEESLAAGEILAMTYKN